MSAEDDTEEITKIVQECATKIAEHVDTVQIMVTFHRGGEVLTKSYEYGIGNFYARQGQVDEWLRIQRQYQRNYADRNDAEDNETE